MVAEAPEMGKDDRRSRRMYFSTKVPKRRGTEKNRTISKEEKTGKT